MQPSPLTPQLVAGTTLAQRFVIEAPVGSGGMGVVYRARDLSTQKSVALKLLHADTRSTFILEHFLREAEILESLRHPHIVTYIAHGRTNDDKAYLAMEWLDGEDLQARLQRGPLSLSEAVRLMTLVAGALSAAHERGIVHRDLKPSNLFLRHLQIEEVQLLDFGVARRVSAQAALTRTGVVVGTPEYMAPEQVRAERSVGPAADVFSLGCLWHECLTGRPPFFGEQVVSVLAKILFEDPPDVRKTRPGVPAEHLSLLARMLAKDAAQRIADGAQLLTELSRLPAFEEDEVALAATRVAMSRPSGLRGDVQELLCVVLASGSGEVRIVGEETAKAATMEALQDGQRELLKGLRELSGHADFLLDGSLIAVFRQWQSATDQAVQAARAALLIHERWPDAQVAVTTGRGTRPGELAVGEVLERAARLVSENMRDGAPEVLLDEVTTGLVDSRFTVEKKENGAFVLRGASESLDETRPLLGKPTPCVGRERELTQLESLYAATIDEPLAQAVLVTGPPGSGKSRLRHEFLRRLHARGQAPLILLARGAPLSMGTAFGLAGQALRGLCGVNDCKSDGERRQRFYARIGERLSQQQASRIVPFLAVLGQLEGTFASDAVRAAQKDPALMQEQLCGAFIELLTAECAAQPVLLLLEDLHWGDAATVRLIDLALRELSEQPLFVLGLCRPEVHESFPKLWQQRQRQMPAQRSAWKLA